jgi:hypothetical protein
MDRPRHVQRVPKAGVSTCKKIVGRIARSTGASAIGDIPFGLRAAESSLRVRTTAAALTLILVRPTYVLSGMVLDRDRRAARRPSKVRCRFAILDGQFAFWHQASAAHMDGAATPCCHHAATPANSYRCDVLAPHKVCDWAGLIMRPTAKG